jgi:uncharacterized RDD family membrane protein YckC
MNSAGLTPSETDIRPAARPAHLGWRLLALTYDALPMIPLLMLVSALSLWLHGGHTIEDDPLQATLQLILMWAAVGLYFVASWRRGGQTMGMRPWRLQVLAYDGRLAGWGALWLRYGIASLSLGLGLLWCLVDRQRRGLHDLASGTILVRRDA